MLHTYHLIPRAAGKANAVAAHMRRRELAPEEMIAIGDSRGDLEVAEVVGRFYLVANGLAKDPDMREAIAGAPNVTVTEEPMSAASTRRSCARWPSAERVWSRAAWPTPPRGSLESLGRAIRPVGAPRLDLDVQQALAESVERIRARRPRSRARRPGGSASRPRRPPCRRASARRAVPRR